MTRAQSGRRAPLALREVRPPFPPRRNLGARLVQSTMLGVHHGFSFSSGLRGLRPVCRSAPYVTFGSSLSPGPEAGSARCCGAVVISSRTRRPASMGRWSLGLSGLWDLGLIGGRDSPARSDSRPTQTHLVLGDGDLESNLPKGGVQGHGQLALGLHPEIEAVDPGTQLEAEGT